MLRLFCLLALLTLQGSLEARQRAQRFPPGPRPSAPPNIVLILADDMGVDLIGAYGEAPNPPCTPNLDQLAAQGLLFRNAWTNPVCSPTRAQTLTGRYGFRTGIGSVVPGSTGLLLAETTIPEMLGGYSSAAFGKWHLGGGLGASHPNDQGFSYFAGSLGGMVPNYFSWSKTTNGSSATTTNYATTDTADEAIQAALTLPQPWFLYVCFNAPHTPVHAPPTALCPVGPCSTNFCDSNPTGTVAQTKAMTEAMDTEIGRLLAIVQAVDPQAIVLFMGDNGTAGGASQPPFVSSHAKGTVYEGGVNVPLIVRGQGVVQGECAGLVSSADLAATITELAGLATSAEDSVSMVPYFTAPTLSLRSTVYTETFLPNHGSLPFTDHDRAVRNERYKLIRRTGQADEFYDLGVDPFETANLFPTLVGGTPANDNYLALVQALVDLGVD